MGPLPTLPACHTTRHVPNLPQHGRLSPLPGQNRGHPGLEGANPAGWLHSQESS
ncbi:Hypothetical protein AA314_01900 [Archangium gephyra]|uniref:Uncharacterized protein n=1 Tax=Archangium gephyra TaxID=48 RepID=A0AAC8Q369_9BACT|nr:Hypothetical protein AA314_01900 [Archangium gephyra]